MHLAGQDCSIHLRIFHRGLHHGPFRVFSYVDAADCRNCCKYIERVRRRPHPAGVGTAPERPINWSGRHRFCLNIFFQLRPLERVEVFPFPVEPPALGAFNLLSARVAQDSSDAFFVIT